LDLRKALKQMELFNKDVETPIEMNKKANKITQEAAILTVFKHKNIIKFYSSFRVEDYFYIVTEFCEVSLTLYNFACSFNISF
jgi:serine/threonine protein kinase